MGPPEVNVQPGDHAKPISLLSIFLRYFASTERSEEHDQDHGEWSWGVQAESASDRTECAPNLR